MVITVVDGNQVNIPEPAASDGPKFTFVLNGLNKRVQGSWKERSIKTVL